MSCLWDEERRQNSPVLRLDTLQRLGGSVSIVKNILGEALSNLSPEEQQVAASMFRFLVTPSGTKIAYTASDLAHYIDLPEERLLPVLTKLSEIRILRPVTPVSGDSKGGRYEIFHDLLAPPIMSWGVRYAEEAAERQMRERHEGELSRKRQQEQARRVRRAAVAPTGLLVLTSALTTYAFRQRTAASRYAAAEAEARKEAEQARVRAEASAEEAQHQAEIAKKNTDRAERSEAAAVAARERAEASAASERAAKEREAAARAEADRNAAEAVRQKGVAEKTARNPKYVKMERLTLGITRAPIQEA